jgi:hypothetical protein
LAVTRSLWTLWLWLKLVAQPFASHTVPENHLLCVRVTVMVRVVSPVDQSHALPGPASRVTVCPTQLGFTVEVTTGAPFSHVAFRSTSVTLVPSGPEAVRRKRYTSATSGTKIGLRTAESESAAVELAGRRTIVHWYDVALPPTASSWRATPVTPVAASIVAISPLDMRAERMQLL